MSTTVNEEHLRASGKDGEASVALWIALLIGLSAVVGGLAAVFWASIVTVPTWKIQPDGTAVMSERGITEVVAADVWFVITGAMVGVGLGLVTWKWFRSLGWPCALLAAGAGLVAGVVCWQVGQVLGPGPEAERIATALPGAVVPAALQLRSLSALAVWAFAAVTPVLLVSSLGPDAEDASSRRRRRAGVQVQEAEPEAGTVDERGVFTEPEQSPVSS